METVAPRSRRTRPAKTPLSREAVVAAGLEILAAEGLAAVTMRRVAEALDTGPASLYVYVANAQELHRALLDAVMGQVSSPEPDPARWREQLLDLMVAALATMDRYPGIARVALADVPTGANALRHADTMLGLLRAGGVSEQAAAWGADALSLYLTGTAVEHSIQLERDWSEERLEAYYEEIRRTFADLPAETHPHIAALVPFLTQGDGDERFRFGVEVLLNGLLHTPAPTVAPWR